MNTHPCQNLATFHGHLLDGHVRYLYPYRVTVGVWPGLIGSQHNRRNLTEADILRCIETLDKRQTKSEAGKMGRDTQLGQAPEGASPEHTAPPIKSARKTAELLGISPRQVERARTIIDHAPEDPPILSGRGHDAG